MVRQTVSRKAKEEEFAPENAELAALAGNKRLRPGELALLALKLSTASTTVEASELKSD